MNPLINPFISLPLLKSYLFDPGRLQKASPQQLKRYKDKAFRHIIAYAYNVPFYHKKYKQAGIHPKDISGIDDIKKIPTITKNDIKNNFPNDILPTNYNRKQAHIVCTGGTTGKPLCIYTDFFTIGKSTSLIIRQLQLCHINWKKIKFVHIGNFNPYRIDLVVQQHFQPHLKFFIASNRQLNIDVSTPIKKIMQQLDSFKPDVIMTYPATFQHLAFLKRKGYGANVSPRLCWTGGAMLDDYTRRYVEDAFDCKLLNIYPSVEAGADIAFECEKGTWHVHDDFFHLEAIDEQGDFVAPGERGHVVLTRLWGRGTPIIRYTGMDDWVRLSSNKTCSCGITSTVIEGGVEGRRRANIILPNGKIFPPGAFCFITPVLNKLNTFKIKQYQIVQRKIDVIDILLVIDDELREEGPSVETIKEKIREIYEKKVGPDVAINVKEVDEIKHPKDARKPPPIVVSHVTEKEGYRTLDS